MTHTLPLVHKFRLVIALLLAVFISTSMTAFKILSPAAVQAASDTQPNESDYVVPELHKTSHATGSLRNGAISPPSAENGLITATGKIVFPRSLVTTTPAPKKEEPKKTEDAKPATPAPAPANTTDTANAPVAADPAPATVAGQTPVATQAQTKAPAAPANNNSAPAPVAAPMEGTSPAAAQSFARSYLAGKGMGEAEFQCLVTLWNRESGWNFQANNPSSGAYGIPQSLPGSKMSSVGADWQTNPKTQIIWGVGYITGRYGTPCGAVASWNVKGWY